MFEISEDKTTVKTNDYDYIVNYLLYNSYKNFRIRELSRGITFYFEEQDNRIYMKDINSHIDDIENIVYTLLHCGKNIWFDLPYTTKLLKKKANPPTLRRRDMNNQDYRKISDMLGHENSDHGPSHGLLLGFGALGMTKTIDKILEKEFTCGMTLGSGEDFSMAGISSDPDLINLNVNDLIKDSKILNRKSRHKKKIKIPEDDFKPLFKRILNKKNLKWVNINVSNIKNDSKLNDKLSEIDEDTKFIFISDKHRSFFDINMDVRMNLFSCRNDYYIDKDLINKNINEFIDSQIEQYRDYVFFIRSVYTDVLSGKPKITLIIENCKIEKSRYLHYLKLISK